MEPECDPTDASIQVAAALVLPPRSALDVAAVPDALAGRIVAVQRLR
jgi:hypothetical protein